MTISSQSLNQSERMLRIGEVARRADLTVEALRYYERVGLLPPAVRSTGGFREYSPDVVAFLRFVRQMQSLGLSLGEIQQLTASSQRGHRQGCQHVHDVLDRHIADIDERLGTLQALRQTLEDHRRTCQAALHQPKDVRCPAIDAWEQTSR